MRTWMGLVVCVALTIAGCSGDGERDAGDGLGPWIAPQDQPAQAVITDEPDGADRSAGSAADPLPDRSPGRSTTPAQQDPRRSGSSSEPDPTRPNDASVGPCLGWYRYIADDDFDALRSVIDVLDADGHADEADAAADIVRRRGDASLAQIDAVRDLLVAEYDCDPTRS